MLLSSDQQKNLLGIKASRVGKKSFVERYDDNDDNDDNDNDDDDNDGDGQKLVRRPWPRIFPAPKITLDKIKFFSPRLKQIIFLPPCNEAEAEI